MSQWLIQSTCTSTCVTDRDDPYVCILHVAMYMYVHVYLESAAITPAHKYLIHVVVSDGGDGNDLDADEAGVSGGEDVGTTRPVERVHVDGLLREHTDTAVVLDERWEVVEVMRSTKDTECA